MIEQPFRFEDADAGIVTLPPPGVARRDTGVIWLNAGAIRRAGPFRLHVQAARRFAALGYPTLRIDQPGIADHLPAARRPPLQVAGDLLDAFASLSGCRRFVVGGICSAADFGWVWALKEPRIAGLLLLDPLARRSAPGFRRGQLRLLLARGPGGLWALLRRRLSRRATAPRIADDQLREWPAEGKEAGELAELVGRGVECFVLYTGGAASYFTHPRQFREGFGAAARSRQAHFNFWPECDHLFFQPDDRQRLVDAIAGWLDERFGAGA